MNRKSFFFLLLILVGWFSSRTIAQTEVIDRIVAIVGKEPILLSDLNAQTEFYALNNRVEPGTPGLKEQVLDAMINEKLILAKALEDTNIQISEDHVTNELDALIAQRVRQVGSEKRLEEIYGMSITRMKREFRDETRKQLFVQSLQQIKFGNIVATRREVEAFYEQYKDSLPTVPEELEVYHIFKVPKVGESTRSALRAKAQSVLDSLRAGGDFADFAHRYSDDKGTAPSGGDLGFVRRGEFFSEFEESVFSLKDGEISGIVETPIGYHIIQLVERRGEQVHPRHILFKLERAASDADSTIAFLKQLKDSVVNHSVNFSDLAKRNSDDKETAQLGGFLGRLQISQIDQSVVNAVKNLKEGEISDPVEVPFEKTRGYQIILLKKRIPEHPMRLETDYNRIEQLATSYKRNLEYQQWITQLRNEIYWEERL